MKSSFSSTSLGGSVFARECQNWIIHLPPLSAPSAFPYRVLRNWAPNGTWALEWRWWWDRWLVARPIHPTTTAAAPRPHAYISSACFKWTEITKCWAPAGTGAWGLGMTGMWSAPVWRRLRNAIIFQRLVLAAKLGACSHNASTWLVPSLWQFPEMNPIIGSKLGFILYLIIVILFWYFQILLELQRRGH